VRSTPLTTIVLIAALLSLARAQHKAALKVGLQAGDTKANPKDGLTYVWIPPGAFQMGCSPGDEECYIDEVPPHTVTISRAFWMGQTEVTQAAYRRVTGANPSSFHGDRLPVESVTWDQARTYCQAIGMRLPTEAEWEYAARAGNTASRYGDLDAVAWHEGNSGAQTHEVGSKQPNAWGLYDILGNVWEWVSDWRASSYYEQSPSQDPQGPPSGEYRVVRGGDWGSKYPEVGVRVSKRGSSPPDFPGPNLGFRCAGDLP
jgi:formylglycine-generating enzyme required for sulfatase activity